MGFEKGYNYSIPKHSESKVNETIDSLIKERNEIVASDLVKELKIPHHTAILQLFRYEATTKLIESFVRFKCKDGKIARVWIKKDKEEMEDRIKEYYKNLRGEENRSK